MTQGASKAVPEKAPPSAEGGVMVLGLGPYDVLLDSPDASAVIVRGRDGEPSAILARLSRDIWGFSKRGDDDWDEVVSIYCVEANVLPSAVPGIPHRVKIRPAP